MTVRERAPYYFIVGLIWIIIGLIIALLIEHDTSKQIKPLNDRILRQDSIIRDLTANRVEIVARNAIERAQAHADAQTYKDTLKRRESNLTRLKRHPDVISVLTEWPIVDALIKEHDSISVLKDRRIMTLEREVDQLEINMQAITVNFEAQIQAERERYAAQTEITDVYKAEVKKEKKKSLKWKLLGGAAAAWGIYQTAKNAADN